ncbi:MULTISPECIES: TetR/AcrR family transcriptional regulator [unclassified Ruegeria]|uniref:TetR family transcriptional regulator n=1 Tax=unclassified Ruegeria TaxID=2625375 RepID=UPI0014884286|nr:TetR family transcriptional regulator [Ruegeria sp. HKCCD7296]NOD47633.1 TetR family transcriptional regulator [Ruegeria sp. HKCCD5849]NOD52704.1 TetR family transcriptional regulator [Ruegeria sp. HKCCD5851]NOD66123.1 TetR family transcriptional regulator [Ruegeria sp. HKCCD7303]NOE35776.1 TetR family transcriptional regulator [Ruegeria sp. HKCCD7318]NOE40256.1 TetR family transcriptional regulator [Ruegeria sp. HKCCD7319]
MARTIAKDHDQKREQILKMAAKVFADQGFDRASMTLLAKECGISKANIYHYYDSKDAILYDILETYLRELRDRICNVDLSGLNPEQKLRTAVREILFAYQGADDEHRVQISGMSALTDEQQKLLRGYQLDLVNFVRDILKELSPEAFDDAKDKLRGATMSVFGMLNWYYMWNTGAGPKAREDYADLVSTLTVHGVQKL